jgi:cell division protein DivIC
MKRKRIKKNLLFFSVLYLVVGLVLLQSVFSTFYNIYLKTKEKRNFEKQLIELKEKEEELNGTVTKLQNPDYVARYAREKYLYSKDGEIIIRIPEE